MGSYYKQQLNDWKATLDVKAHTVLDIGGAQDPLKGMTKSWDVKDYKIVDLKQPHVLKVQPDIVWDMNEPIGGDYGTDIVPFEPDSADLIFMLGVMDYVINPNNAMYALAWMLKPGGAAWVEFPFFYATHNPIDDEGCRYSEGCIKRLAKQANLEIVDIIRKMERSGGLVRWFQDEGQRMAREYPYHGVTGFICKLKKI